MKKLFGTDGVRGIANKELTPEIAFKLGRIAADVLVDKEEDKKSIIAIGKDTRISGDMLEAALVAGICSRGVNVYILGVVPTPGIAYLTKYLKAQAGIVISASHNSFEDNGIKFFNKYGFKLSNKIENEIEKNILKNDNFLRPIGKKIGRVFYFNKAIKQYENHLKNIFNYKLNNINITIDNANGASSNIMPNILRDLGVKSLHSINDKPNGLNINNNCGSTNMKKIIKEVIKNKSDIGIAHDGDADRILAVDELGRIVDGDKIMGICAKYLKDKKILKNNILISTIMSNLGLHKFCKNEKIKLITTNVGDRYVLEKMIEKNAIIGGEKSGHIIFKNYNTTGDGLLTALILLKVMLEKKEKLSVLSDQINLYPQVLKNVKVKNKEKSLNNLCFLKSINYYKKILKNEGRIFIRPSGTESLIRIMAEGKDQKQIENIVFKLAKIIQE